MSFSAFADGSDETVLDGYHVEDVPYNSNFDTVLTASSSGSQIYLASEHKTYNSPAVVSAPATTVKPLYTTKSVVNMIPRNVWRISDGASKTFPDENGFVGVQYNWANAASPSAPHNISHLTNIPSFDFFKSERKYRITFDLIIKSNSKGTFTFDIVSSSDTSQVVIPLCAVEARVGTGSTLAQGSRSYSIDFTLPSGVDPLLQPKISVSLLTGSEFLFFINDFTVTDVTSEDLDNSLGKFGDRIKGFFDNLVESIKGFFIPEDGFFDDVKSRFDKLLSEHLGFLYEAPSMVGSIFGVVKDWNPPEQPTITLPAFNFDIGNDHIHLWDEQVYTFDFLANQPWSTLYSFYKTFIFVLLSVAMINLAIKKYHSIVGGGDSDDN